MTLREIKTHYGWKEPKDKTNDRPVFGGTVEMIYKGAKITSMIESDDLAKDNEGVYNMKCTKQDLMVDEKDESLLIELVKSWGFIHLKDIRMGDTFVRDNGESYYRIKRDTFKSRSGTIVSFEIYYNKKNG